MAKATISKMANMFKSPPFSIGVGTLVLTLAIFFAEGGFSNMNPLYIIGLVIGSGLILYGLVKAESKNKSQPRYDHDVYVAKMITDSKAEALLALPDALRVLGQLDGELAFEVSRIKRPKNQLIRIRGILDCLRKDLEMRQFSRDWPDKEIWDAVNSTLEELNLSGTRANEETIAFMYHVAGVLDKAGMGISARRESSNQYKLVIRLQASIATQLLNYAVTAYLSYSLGINSILLLFDSCPPDQIGQLKKLFGKTDTELREERRATLAMLLTAINNLKEKELHGQYTNEMKEVP